MPRFQIAACLIALMLPAPAGQAQETDPVAVDPAAEVLAEAPAPLVDTQITIMNQSGQMLMRFEAIPVLAAAEDPATDAATADDPATTDPVAPETVAPDPRLAAGGELLRGGVVSAGNYGVLILPGGASVCNFQFLSTLQDGRVVDEVVDVCAYPIYTLLPPA